MDAFEQLLEFKWRDVSFPCTSFDLTLRHDLAIHKYPDVDGANVEATGRDALSFTATIPFTNGIVPGKAERWGVLYPTQWRAFLKAFADRSTGVLQHPDLGLISCKPVELRATTSAERRGGTDVEATWIETEDAPTDTESLFAGDSPITTAEIGALDLDASLGPAREVFPSLPTYDVSFEEFMRSVTSATDQVSLLSKRVAGKVDSITYRLNTLSASVDAARSPLLWPLRQSIERMRGSIPDVKKALGDSGKTLAFYTVPQDTTIAGLCVDTGAKVGDIVRLNRELLRSPVVKGGTVVRYYK